MAGLQRAATYTRGARCCGDLDRQGSHPHKREAAGNAAGFRQVPAAEHQTRCRCCAPLLVCSLFKLNVFLSPFDASSYMIYFQFLTFHQDLSFICNI